MARRVSVCLTCGDKGETALLIYCRQCQDSAVHHYCMDNVSRDDDNINWWCWDCAPKHSINEPLRKSKRICSKRQKGLKTRNCLKEKLKLNKRLVQISNAINEIGQSNIDHHSPIRAVESQLLNEKRRDRNILGEKSIFEIPSPSKDHNESININEPAFTTKDTLPIQEETSTRSFDKTQEIREFGNKRRIIVLNDRDNSKDEGKNTDLQVPSLVANDHCISSQTLCGQPSLKCDDSVSAEPVIDPKWRGWFNIKEEEAEDDDETCEILAHLSNKACSKVSDATTAMPHMLDIQVLDKHDVWPKCFMVSPPTASSIALYFFPACERDERMYDSLLDEVIEKDLALKAMINNVELLIFSSYELPLQQRRYNGKYFFWGIFWQKQRAHSSTETATASRQQNSKMEIFGHSEPTGGAKNIDLVHSKCADELNPTSVHNQSPLSMNSSQSSNVLPSRNDTPDSVSCPPFKLSRVEETSNCDSREVEEKAGCLIKSWKLYLRPSPNHG